MARVTKSTKAPSAAEAAVVAVQEPPAAVEQAEVRKCRTDGCENAPEERHRYCRKCYQEYLQRRREEDLAKLPEGKAFCTGMNGERPCRWVINERPDGKDPLCPKHDALRLIFGVKAAIAESREAGHHISDELVAKLAEAEDHFAAGEFSKACGAARRFFALRAKASVEYALSQVVEGELSDRAREPYEEAIERYDAERFHEALDAIRRMRTIQQNERDLVQLGSRVAERTFAGRQERGQDAVTGTHTGGRSPSETAGTGRR